MTVLKRLAKVGGGLLVALPSFLCAFLAGVIFIDRLSTASSPGAEALAQWPYGAAMLGAGALGGGAVLLVLDGLGVRLSGSRPEAPDDRPWAVRPAWADSTLETRAATAGHGIAGRVPAAVGGTVLLGIAIGVAGTQSPVAALIPAVPGLGLVGLAAYAFWVRHHYGTRTFEMDPFPGRLGDRVQGRVRTGVAPGRAPDDGFTVALSCEAHGTSPESVVASESRLRDYAPEDPDVDNDTRQDRIIWRETRRVAGTPSTDGREIVLPIDVDAPADLPPSTPRKQSTRVKWMLEIRSDATTPAYRTFFEIPVFPPDGADPDAADDPASPPTDRSGEPQFTRYG